MDLVVHEGVPAELDAITMYRVLALRVDVFVVEQACAYPELDGRDLEDGARWLWATAGAEVVATLRILTDPDGSARIGRVATAAHARSGGTAGALLRRAMELIGPDRTAVLEAQSPLVGFYARFGFRATGPEYLEDGIAHTPMRREAAKPVR